MGKNFRLFVPLDLVQIAEVDGEPAGMLMGLPNLNELICDLNGRLWPFGWAKLLWRIKVKGPTTARATLLGIRRRYQKTPMAGVLALMLIEAVRDNGIRRGIREVELAWVLEDNVGVRHVIESIGAEVYKRYRIYEKALA